MRKIYIFILLLATISIHSHASSPRVERVIYMIGDGMGIAHVTAAMLEDGSTTLNMERATSTALIKTFSANNRVTDSAAAGTALATGVKTNNSTLGIDPEGRHLESIMKRAQQRGDRAGIVVACRITHATPGAFYANVSSRSLYDSIALQFVQSGVDLAMGGGRAYFDRRKDGRNLVEELRQMDYNVVFELEEAERLSDGKLVALLAEKDMPYFNNGRGDYLPRATEKALEILSSDLADGQGLFLMVEGSLIDYAAHVANAKNIVAETLDFDQAVGVAFDYADAHPGTLVVVLADHETGGLSLPSNKKDFKLGESGVAYRFGTSSHTASLIPLFAYGTGAELFTGVLDNTDIPKLIERLMLGEQAVDCDRVCNELRDYDCDRFTDSQQSTTLSISIAN